MLSVTAGATSAGDVEVCGSGAVELKGWAIGTDRAATTMVCGVAQSAVKENVGMCSATSAGMASANTRTAVHARLAIRACCTRSIRSTSQTARARARERTADSPRTLT